MRSKFPVRRGGLAPAWKRLGFRSGLEGKIAEQFTALGMEVPFEPFALRYIRPARKSRYTPDWVLPNGIILESKGIFEADDRYKHTLLKEQYPELDIRFVFTNPNAKLYKGSPTTYAKWCEKEGFLYAKLRVPLDWIKEKPSRLRLAAIAQARTDPQLKE